MESRVQQAAPGGPVYAHDPPQAPDPGAEMAGKRGNYTQGSKSITELPGSVGWGWGTAGLGSQEENHSSDLKAAEPHISAARFGYSYKEWGEKGQ